MENQNMNEGLFDVELDESIKKLLHDIARWARFIAIFAFIGYGIALAEAITNGSPEGSSSLGTYAGRASSILGAIIGGAIGIAINIYLLRFGNQTRQAINEANQDMLDKGFNNLRTYFKIIGILAIIMLAFMGIFLLLAVLAGSLTRF